MYGCYPGTPEDGRRLPILRLKFIRDWSTALIGQPGALAGASVRSPPVRAYSPNLKSPGVTSGVTEQGYKVPVVPSEARLPLLHGWDSLSGEQQAAVQAVCHAKTQPAKPARPDPMAWAPPAPTTKVAQGKKRKATEPQAQPLPLPLVAGYIVVD